MLEPEEASQLVLAQLGSTAMFAAKFREAASRALLLPRRRADGRTPLWQQRKRSYDLLNVAANYPAFPMLLETYRECLRDVFDMPALMDTLAAIERRTIRVHVTDSRTPSPFAGALLFSYVANYIYDGDAPLAERRAQALSIDQDQLRELLGDADLRELLDAAAIEETEEQLQCVTEGYKARSVDGVHDLLLRLGDLSRDEIAARCEDALMLPRALTGCSRPDARWRYALPVRSGLSRWKMQLARAMRSVCRCRRVFRQRFWKLRPKRWWRSCADLQERTDRLLPRRLRNDMHCPKRRWRRFCNGW